MESEQSTQLEPLDAAYLPRITALPPSKWIRRSFATLLCWGYLLGVVALILVIRTSGDRTWPATLLIFAPRWGVLLPLVILIPLALWAHRRLLIVLSVASVAAVFPLMGFRIGWHRFASRPAGGLPIRVVAFNVHHNDLNDPAVVRFFASTHADVVTLEEVPPRFNRQLFPAGAWQLGQTGELCIASRFPILSGAEVYEDLASGYRLKTPAGPVNLIVVHLSSPHYALRDTLTGESQGPQDLMLNIHQRDAAATRLRQLIGRTNEPLIIAGDFNMAFDSQLFSKGFSSMVDSYDANGLGFGWTYANGWTSVRIDHVLSNDALDSVACYVGPFLGSPHRPVVADLILKPRP